MSEHVELLTDEERAAADAALDKIHDSRVADATAVLVAAGYGFGARIVRRLLAVEAEVAELRRSQAEAERLRTELAALKGSRVMSVIFGHHQGAPRPFALHQHPQREPAYLGAQWPDGYVAIRPGPSGGLMPWRSIDALLADCAASGQDLTVVWLSDELEPLAAVEQQRDEALAEVTRLNGVVMTWSGLNKAFTEWADESLDIAEATLAAQAETLNPPPDEETNDAR